MNIAEILAKVAKNETITDDERKFVAEFDFTKSLNDAAASARRKAEAELGKSQADVERLTKELEEARTETDGKANTEIAKLTRKLENLNAAFAEMKEKANQAEADNARMIRDKAIADYASTNGIAPAKGIKEATFLKFFREAVGDTDIADAEAMKKVVEGFRSDYAGMIHNGGTAVPSSGKPVDKSFSSTVNPFKKETYNLDACMSLINSNRSLAKSLAEEAGDPLAETI